MSWERFSVVAGKHLTMQGAIAAASFSAGKSKSDQLVELAVTYGIVLALKSVYCISIARVILRYLHPRILVY